MQSSDDLPPKVSRKKPKPNNKTKTLAKTRPGEDFKNRDCSLNRERQTSESCSVKVADANCNQVKNKIKSEISNNFQKTKIKTEDSNLKLENSLNHESKMETSKSREEILAARQAKKNAKKEPEKKTINIEKKNEKNVVKELKCNIVTSETKSTVSVIENDIQSNAAKEQPKKPCNQKQINELKTNMDTNQSKLVPAELNVGDCNISTEKSVKSEKTREEIMAEREAKKMAKQSSKMKNKESTINPVLLNIVDKKMEQCHITENVVPVTEKKPILSKAERRAIQEAQRAAKTKVLEDKQKTTQKKPLNEITQKPLQNIKLQNELIVVKEKSKRLISPMKFAESIGEYKVKLFKHLDRENLQEKNQFINHSHIHPAIVQLGEQFATRTVVGSNARCIAFLKALKTLIQDYQTPPKKEFTRGLEENIHNCVQYLDKCRPLAVSVCNAHKTLQSVLRHLSNDSPESELKMRLCEHIETYIKDQIEKAAQAISSFVQQKISNGDVILTFSCSSLIYQILEEAHNRKIDFRVIVVDSRPFCEGQELLRKLVLKEIPCTYVLINAVGFIMPEVTKILMGAHALLANGYVMARTGTAQIALVAKSFNVPVLVCCETHKFSERVQTDAFVYNELGNPDDLVMNKSCKLSNWQKGSNKILPLNLNYDITPPELVTAVVTEVAILPCTSVPVILRLRPTDFVY